MLKFVYKVQGFLGIGLPSRSIPLAFSLPAPSDKFQASDTDDDDFLDDLAIVKDLPAAYFARLLEEVKYVNRCSMSNQKRWAINHDMLKLFYPAAQTQIALLSKTGDVPESDQHKTVLLHIIEFCQILIVSYQLIFADYYASSNYRYARARTKVLTCASRILELLTFKQRARGLRYQLLDDTDWAIANTLFYVMYRYEDVYQPLSTLKKELDMGHHHHKISLYQHFMQLHLSSAFDVLRWPTHLQWVIGSYVRSIEQPALIRPDDGTLGEHDLRVYCYGTSPANTRRLAHPPGEALLLDCHPLIHAMHKDCVGMMRAKTQRNVSQSLPRFANLPEAEHFVIFDQLVRGLEYNNIKPIGHVEQNVNDLRIFVGFTEVFGLLHHRNSIYASEERLADMLARRSALIAEDNAATHESIWKLLFQDDKIVRLSTQETDFTTAMRIGSLLACGIGENVNRPSLAMVSRIFRPCAKVVIVEIHRIADYAEPVLMSVNAPSDQPLLAHQKKPALLVYDHKQPGHWSLMFPPQDVVLGIDHFAIHRQKITHPVHLHGIRHATNDFYLFSTALESAQLGITGEPDYPIPPALKHHAAGWLL